MIKFYGQQQNQLISTQSQLISKQFNKKPKTILRSSFSYINQRKIGINQNKNKNNDLNKNINHKISLTKNNQINVVIQQNIRKGNRYTNIFEGHHQIGNMFKNDSLKKSVSVVFKDQSPAKLSGKIIKGTQIFRETTNSQCPFSSQKKLQQQTQQLLLKSATTSTSQSPRKVHKNVLQFRANSIYLTNNIVNKNIRTNQTNPTQILFHSPHEKAHKLLQCKQIKVLSNKQFYHSHLNTLLKSQNEQKIKIMNYETKDDINDESENFFQLIEKVKLEEKEKSKYKQLRLKENYEKLTKDSNIFNANANNTVVGKIKIRPSYGPFRQETNPTKRLTEQEPSSPLILAQTQNNFLQSAVIWSNQRVNVMKFKRQTIEKYTNKVMKSPNRLIERKDEFIIEGWQDKEKNNFNEKLHNYGHENQVNNFNEKGEIVKNNINLNMMVHKVTKCKCFLLLIIILQFHFNFKVNKQDQKLFISNNIFAFEYSCFPIQYYPPIFIIHFFQFFFYSVNLFIIQPFQYCYKNKDKKINKSELSHIFHSYQFELSEFLFPMAKLKWSERSQKAQQYWSED